MNTKTKKPRIVDFTFSGTLGDAFLVLCKLSDYHKNTGHNVRLHRQSEFIEFDDPISKLCSLFPYVEYVIPSTYFDSKSGLKRPSFNGDYINTTISGISAKEFPHDPQYIDFDPYPILDLNPASFPKTSLNIGIQLHTGKLATNYKGLSIEWIKSVITFLNIHFDKKIVFYIFGTGEGYDDKDLNELLNLPNTNFLVGKTSFVDWVSSIVSLDFFITPEGFSSYVAMSQKIPSLVFYTSDLILLGIHDKWRNSSVFIDVVRHDILSKAYRYLMRLINNRSQFWLRLVPCSSGFVLDIIKQQIKKDKLRL